ncbi:MAG TPA: VOC family protein [Acidimicrobiales bacterium]|nr:VOC family protein [Acidimicrobiales bacterium]
MAPFRIGKLFHLTPLVDDLVAAEAFFTGVFAPLTFYRGYSSHWHRNASLMAVADAVIEPLQPLAPDGDGPGTSWYRYMARFGPRVHNVALYGTGLDELGRRLDEHGVRHTDAGVATTLFIHPKDSPGMIEFSDPGAFRGADPRFSPHWDVFAADYWPNGHPLGLRHLSHTTIVVTDVEAAVRFYTDLLDARTLPDQAGAEGGRSRFVVVGEGTVLELAQPAGPGRLADELARAGESVTGVTFRVGDAEAAARHVEERVEMKVTLTDGRAAVDAASTWGCEYAFSDRALEGDPRG